MSAFREISKTFLQRKKIYIADTGNNRVIRVRVPFQGPDAVWSAMKQQLLAGNIEGALSKFASSSAARYRELYYRLGTTELNASIAQIPAISPVGGAYTFQYSFDLVMQGETITFPIEFVKENGLWKILEY